MMRLKSGLKRVMIKMEGKQNEKVKILVADSFIEYKVDV